MHTNSYYHALDIGPVHTEGNLILAPMAGYTDRPFRTLCLEQGANLTVTEMVSTEGVARHNDKTTRLMRRAEGEEKLAIQIFTSNLDSLERCLDQLLAANPTIIDINCGCPVPKVIKTGAGSALMKTPEVMGSFVKFLTSHCDIPVSVKLRTGWDSEHENFLDFSKVALDNGASLLTMHARTRAQGYAPTAHWDRLQTLSTYVHTNYPGVPVIGSGDLFTPYDAKKMIEETAVDGIMFARGVIGQPQIFKQTREYLLHDTEPVALTAEERKNFITRQLHLMIDNTNEILACKEMRKHCCAYLKGIEGGSAIRKILMTCETEEDYIKALQSLS